MITDSKGIQTLSPAPAGAGAGVLFENFGRIVRDKYPVGSAEYNATPTSTTTVEMLVDYTEVLSEGNTVEINGTEAKVSAITSGVLTLDSAILTSTITSFYFSKLKVVAQGVSNEFTVNASAHGFTSGSIGKLIFKKEDGTYILGIATALDYCALFIGELVAIPSADTLTCTKGRVTKTAHGYTGQSLCLSATTAGTMQSTTPDYGFVKAVANIIDANTLEYIDSPAIAISNMTIRIPSNENLLVNGDMQIAQDWSSITGVSNATYLADNWLFEYSAGSSFNFMQGLGFIQGKYKKYISLISTAGSTPTAAQYVQLSTRIEGLDFIKLWGQKTTLSFKFYSPINGFICVLIMNEINTRKYLLEVPVSVGWNNCSALIPLDNVDGVWNFNNTCAARIYFVLQAGSNYLTNITNTWVSTGNAMNTGNQSNFFATTGNEIRIADVKWEYGTEQTDLIARDFETELRKCQRYYWRHTDYVGSFNSRTSNGYVALGLCKYPVTMRTTPSIYLDQVYCFNTNSSLAGAIAYNYNNECITSLYYSPTFPADSWSRIVGIKTNARL